MRFIIQTVTDFEVSSSHIINNKYNQIYQIL